MLYENRTISVWFKVDRTENNNILTIYEEDGDSQGLEIYLEDDRLIFKTWDRVGNKRSGNYLATKAIAADTWHHAAIVVDSSQPFTAYLDGQVVDFPAVKSPQNLDVGVGGLSSSNPGDRDNPPYTVKDIRVYDRSFSRDEINLIYQPNSNPIATDDVSLAVEDNEVILFADFLLSNDRDSDGDIITLDKVGQAVNGTVSLDEKERIVFIPEPDFNGEASFEYTIKDDRGGISTGRVNITVLAETSPILVGTNLHRLADWSRQLPFLNGFKSARQWLTQDIEVTRNEEGQFVNTWNTGEFGDLDLDANGWLKSLPDAEDEADYTSVGTILYRDLGDYPGGEYVVLYEGEGTIKYEFDAVKDEAVSIPGRDVINVTPSNAGIWLRITETDPNQTGDYLRDIQIMPAEYEYADNQIFNPAFLEKIQPFTTLRFMDWMATNHSTQGEWDNRPTPDSSVFSGEIASLESMVELANRTDTDPWFTIPHMATDEYITNFAQYVKDNLDPELEIYVEYSNEVWNRDFDQGWWVEAKGIEEYADSDVGDFAKRIDWYSQRTTEITQIWDDVFAADKDRVIGVMSGQAANSWTAQRALEYRWADTPLSSAEYGIDAISFAPYFGSYLGKSEYEAEIESWTEELDGGLDLLFAELTTGGLLPDAPTRGALQQSYYWTENYVALGDLHDLDLLTYESGQHLRGNDGVEDNQAITELFTTANRDPRMGEIYQEYFTTLDELGVDLAVNYTDVSDYNKWGSWGALEHINQSTSPKYGVLESLVANNDNNLPPQIGEFNHNLSNLGIIVTGEVLTVNTNYTDVGLQDYHLIEFDWGNGSLSSSDSLPLLGDVGEINHTYIYYTPGTYNATLTITDDDNLSTQESLSVTVAQAVDLDWKLRSTSQQTNLAGEGEIRVAIFGREDLDVSKIDPTSIKADDDRDAILNGSGVAPIIAQTNIQEVNGDLFPDLVLAFDKPTLRSVVTTNANSIIDDDRIYLFGANANIEGDYFFASE